MIARKNKMPTELIPQLCCATSIKSTPLLMINVLAVYESHGRGVPHVYMALQLAIRNGRSRLITINGI